MKEFVRYLLGEEISSLQIGLFDVWHFLYLFVIFFSAILVAVLMRKKSSEAKDKVLRIYAYLVIGFYIADFFLVPLSDSYDRISVDKLPFHVCTLAGVFVPFVQFNPKFAKIRSVIVTLAIASSMMWMCYPGSALGGQPPFSYIIFQTFIYHGLLFSWGFLHLALGKTVLSFRKIWMELAAVLIILVWATLGNTLYDAQNWFFVEYSIFPFLTDEIMPPVVVFCVFGTCFLVYCAFYGVRGIARRVGGKGKSSLDSAAPESESSKEKELAGRT